MALTERLPSEPAAYAGFIVLEWKKIRGLYDGINGTHFLRSMLSAFCKSQSR